MWLFVTWMQANTVSVTNTEQMYVKARHQKVFIRHSETLEFRPPHDSMRNTILYLPLWNVKLRHLSLNLVLISNWEILTFSSHSFLSLLTFSILLTLDWFGLIGSGFVLASHLVGYFRWLFEYGHNLYCNAHLIMVM